MLVTGADGFVGHWLVRALAGAGASVRALVWSGLKENAPALRRLQLPGVEIVTGDITDLAFVSELLRRSRIDTVYHLAAININIGTAVSPYAVFETNLRGVYTLLEACRTAAHPVSAVLASSKEVEDCFLPATARKHHPYMASKAAAELVARAYHDTYSVPVVRVRSDNLYGGSDFNWARLVPGTIRSVLRGETPTIRSNGLLRRDYVYIEDAVAAYLAIGERLAAPRVRGNLFRIATGIGTSTLDVVRQITDALGRPELSPRVLNEKTEERVDSFYTPGLEGEVLGWQARFTLPEGVARTCAWYRDYFQSAPDAR